MHEVLELQSTIASWAVDQGSVGSSYIAHFLKRVEYHRLLQGIKLARGEVAEADWVTDSSEKDRGIVRPGSLPTDVAGGEGTCMEIRFFAENLELGLLIGDSGLLCTHYFVGGTCR